MKKSYVYKIVCKITGEFYFGSSFNAKSDRYWGSGRKIKERIALYGKENFIKEILGEFDDRVEAHKVENEYIEQFRHDVKCLNERLEHHFGAYSDETRARTSASHCGEKNPMFGKTLSEEHRSKIGDAERGKIVSDDTRSKLSVANRGKKFSEEHKARISAAHRGKTLSYETRAKIGDAHRGKIVSDYTRAKLSAARRGKHWRKNPVTGKREYYD